MAENEAGAEPGVGFAEGGALTQEALDALLAAATAEGDEAPDPDAWASELAAAAEDEAVHTPPSGAAGTGVLDLPSFDTAPVFGTEATGAGLTRVRDIPLEVTVELGRTRLLIRDILGLGTGSIIELDKLAGEPVDLFANGLLIARGEVIVIDDNFGVRVTEIITAADRNQTKQTDAIAA